MTENLKLDDDSPLKRYNMASLLDDLDRYHFAEFGFSSRNCAHCLNRWAYCV